MRKLLVALPMICGACATIGGASWVAQVNALDTLLKADIKTAYAEASTKLGNGQPADPDGMACFAPTGLPMFLDNVHAAAIVSGAVSQVEGAVVIQASLPDLRRACAPWVQEIVAGVQADIGQVATLVQALGTLGVTGL